MDSLWFSRPLWLLALLPLAACWWWIISRRRPAGEGWQRIVDARLLPHVLADGGRSRWAMLWPGLLALAWLLCILALAGPQPGGQPALERPLPRAQVLLIEIPEKKGLSAKSLANFEAFMRALQKMVGQFEGQETAVVLYARQSFLIVPPTLDRISVADLLRDLSPGLLPEYGARPDRALTMVSEVLRRNKLVDADLYWVTAGNIAPPDRSAPSARLGRISVLYYGDDAALAAQLQTDTLTSDGVFVAGEQAASFALPAVGTAPAASVSSEQDGVPYRACLVLLIIPLALLAFRPVAHLAAFVLALSGGLTWPDQANAEFPSRPAAERQGAGLAWFSDLCQPATTAYRQGRYAEASDLWAKCPGADAAYNRGNALARAGRLKDAIAAYDKALLIRPAEADFGFNRGIVQAIIKQPPPPPLTPGAEKSPIVEFNEVSPPVRQSAGKSLEAQRTASEAAGKSPEVSRAFLRQLILLQELHRKKP